MAERGRPIDAATVMRIRRCCAVYRLSVRKAARECGVSTATLRKYKPRGGASASGPPA